MAMATPQVILPTPVLLPTPSVTPVIDPQVIARAFVDQYYRILHRSPDQVYRFYQETSILSRPDVNGTMVSATTLEGINQKIMSMDVGNYFWEIETADSQPSYMGGVFIVVTGCLTGPDRVRRPFSQSFFLAPQDTNGYYVHNDVLRTAIDRTVILHEAASLVPIMANGNMLVAGGGAISLANCVPVQANGITPLQSNGNAPVPSNDAVSVSANGTGGRDTIQALLPTPNTESTDLEGSHISEPSKEDHVVSVHPSNGEVNVKERAMNGLANGGSDKGDNMGNGVAPSGNKEAKKKQHIEEVAPQHDAPKKSYALIVMKGSPISKPVEVAAKNPKSIEKVEKPAPAPSPAAPAPAPAKQVVQEATVASDANDSRNNSNEVQGSSIFVKNLPNQVKPEQLEEAYGVFGAVKHGGVQVRMNRYDHYWFGFVEFESPESMHAAIEAQPITINGKEVYCEEKRGFSRVVNGMHVRNENGNGNTVNQSRGPPIRNNNGYRNDNYRGGRAQHGRGRGQRAMSGTMRPREGYHPQQRSYHNSNGRFPAGLKSPSETPVAA